MNAAAIDEAARLLAEARLTRAPLTELPEHCRPSTIAEGHAVQDALIRRLGERVAGWKVAGLKPGEVMRGAVLASRMLEAPARLIASEMPLLGVEAEIAFRFDRALAPRERDYDRQEIVDAVTALPAVEVVDTRFASYKETPLLHRLGDCMSNGALICGKPRSDWRDFDLPKLEVTVSVDGEVVHRSVGGHGNGDPLLPALSLTNELRSGPGILAGQIVTTGTYSGLRFLEGPSRLMVSFTGFGEVEVTFDA
jgi:2-keto-4-pentenoate hydratase